MTIEPFKPIKTMQPKSAGNAGDVLYNRIIKAHKGITFGEVKEDGQQFQIHKWDGVCRAFSRDMNEYNLALYPELTESFARLPDNSIFASELVGDEEVGIESRLLVASRAKNSNPDVTMPLGVRVFDTLYWEGSPLIKIPEVQDGLTLEERREFTERIQEKRITPSTKRDITSADEIGEWFEDLESRGYEGLVCKNPASLYVPGRRAQDWIKVKRSEPLDLVVLGIYLKDGRADQMLCGTFNDETGMYEPLGKVNAVTAGIGLELQTEFADHFQEERPEGVVFSPHMKGRKIPSLYLPPEVAPVFEIRVTNFGRTKAKSPYTCGAGENGSAYSIMHAVFERRRNKRPIDATTTEQIAEFYRYERPTEL